MKFNDDGYVIAVLPSSKEPDWETVFPASQVPRGIALIDEFGNPQCTISVSTHTEIDNFGTESVVQSVSFSIDSREPTDEQKEAKRAQDISHEIRREYTLEDEIGKLRSAIIQLASGEPLPEDFITQSEVVKKIKAANPREGNA